MISNPRGALAANHGPTCHGPASLITMGYLQSETIWDFMEPRVRQ